MRSGSKYVNIAAVAAVVTLIAVLFAPAGDEAGPTAGVPRVVTLIAVLFAPAASAQTVEYAKQRDQLIASQEDLLNTYRRLFGVDVNVVPGG